MVRETGQGDRRTQGRGGRETTPVCGHESRVSAFSYQRSLNAGVPFGNPETAQCDFWRATLGNKTPKACQLSIS